MHRVHWVISVDDFSSTCTSSQHSSVRIKWQLTSNWKHCSFSEKHLVLSKGPIQYCTINTNLQNILIFLQHKVKIKLKYNNYKKCCWFHNRSLNHIIKSLQSKEICNNSAILLSATDLYIVSILMLLKDKFVNFVTFFPSLFGSCGTINNNQIESN